MKSDGRSLKSEGNPFGVHASACCKSHDEIGADALLPERGEDRGEGFDPETSPKSMYFLYLSSLVTCNHHFLFLMRPILAFPASFVDTVRSFVRFDALHFSGILLRN